MPRKRKNSGLTSSNNVRNRSCTRSKISRKSHSRSRSKKRKRSYQKSGVDATGTTPNKHSKLDLHSRDSNPDIFENKIHDDASGSSDEDGDNKDEVISASNDQSLQLKNSKLAANDDSLDNSRKRNADEANIDNGQTETSPKRQQTLNVQMDLLQISTGNLKITPSPWNQVRNYVSERRMHPERYWVPNEWIESID